MGQVLIRRRLALAICCLFLQLCFTSACDPRDRAALLAFKAGTDRDNTGLLSSWVQGGDCCSFYAVTCNSKGRVVNLTIKVRELLPDCDGDYDPCPNLQRKESNATLNLLGKTIAKLSALKVLYLRNVNFLQDSLPTGLSKLKNLKVLHLEEANFVGPLNADLGKIASLTDLSLRENYNLDGPLPTFLCGLHKLVSIDLSHNALEGSLPACIGYLPQLQTLRVAYNSLSGPLPASISGLRKLQELNVTDNHFSGRMPSLPIPSLKVLNLDGNDFVGTIPPQYGSLLCLVDLRLGGLNVSAPVFFEPDTVIYSKLAGTIPQQLGALKKLQVLHIRASKIQGVIPQSFSTLVNLVELELDRNRLSGPVPDFSKLTKLQTLDLEDNLF